MTAVETGARRVLPPGGGFETWAAPDGWPLRVGVWPGGPCGTLLFLNGRGDFAEKYAEALHHWRARGWAVIAPDWRGQGGSERWSPGRQSFEIMVGHLQMIAARAARAHAGPLVAVGHSMGAHLLLRAVIAGTPGIGRAVLLAPMLGLNGGALTRMVTRAALALGLGDQAAPGQGARDATAQARRAPRLTSDPARQTDEAWWVARHPELASPGATWGWLDAALRSIAWLGDATPRPPLPVRAVLAGADQVVDIAAARALLTRLIGTDAIFATLPGAQHELLRETDATQAALYALIDPWLEQA